MVYEDLTGFTLWGDQQAKITAVTTTRSTVTELIRSDEAILYKDYGSGHFDLGTGIEHDFDFYIDATSYGGGGGEVSTYMTPWGLANAVNDLEALKTGNENFIVASIAETNTNDVFFIRINEWKNNARYAYDTSGGLSIDTPYFVKIIISGNSLVFGIYSTIELRDAGDGTDGDVDNLAITLSSSTFTFQYLYSVMSRDNFVEDITMWQQQYDIHEVVALEPVGSIIPILQGIGIL